MWAILVVVVVNWSGNAQAGVSTSVIGGYDTKVSCQSVANELNGITRKGYVDVVTTARCVQVKEKK